MKKPDLILANENIRYRSVRLVTDDSSSVMNTDTARQMANNARLDLVLINATASPPICKIVDLNKYKYEQKQKIKAAERAQRAGKTSLKEVQFKVNIDQHDFETKCKKIDKFLTKGNAVKVQIQFKGRERQHPDLGFDIVNRVLDTVDVAALEGKPQFNGNNIIAILKGKPIGTA